MKLVNVRLGTHTFIFGLGYDERKMLSIIVSSPLDLVHTDVIEGNFELPDHTHALRSYAQDPRPTTSAEGNARFLSDEGMYIAGFAIRR